MGKLMSAIATGWRAGVAEFRDPGRGARAQTRDELAEEFSRLWAYYRNKSEQVYSPAYLNYCRARDRALYTYTRLLYNPIPTIVSFYEDHLFPGVASEVKDEKGVTLAHLATPLAEGARAELQQAIAQIDQWSNWLSESARFVRFGAALGCVGAEVLDLDTAEKVTHRILWPSWVDMSALQLDEAGNVKAYALEYKVRERSESYTFRKEVDGESFRYLRDGKLFDPPERGSSDSLYVSRGVYDNPYGFVPMVWCKHLDDGDVKGQPAVWNPEKVDEVNSTASHQIDRTHKGIEGGKVMSTSGDILAVTGAAGTSKRGEAGGITRGAYDPRFDWTVLKMVDGSVDDLDSGFDPTKADSQIDRLLKSFERDYPELQAQEVIQNKNQLSGAALERMLAPSQAKLDRAFAAYGQQVMKLKQMSVAIAGWRASGNGWTMRDAQREVFRKFSLDSYQRGALNFSLKRPLLVQSTPMEEAELRAKRLENAKTGEGLLDDLTRLTDDLGYPADRAADILKARGPKDEAGGSAA